MKKKVFGNVKIHPQNNELTIGKRHLKDFIASVRVFWAFEPQISPLELVPLKKRGGGLKICRHKCLGSPGQ